MTDGKMVCAGATDGMGVGRLVCEPRRPAASPVPGGDQLEMVEESTISRKVHIRPHTLAPHIP